MSKIDIIMSKQFGITGETIYCVNEDGSITNIAIIDLGNGDIRPVDNEVWYSELEGEIENLKKVQNNYSKLLSLVSDTNKQIITTKSVVTDLIRTVNKGFFNHISQAKNIGIICFVYIALFLGVSVFTIIGDFFPDIVPVSWLQIIKIVHIILIFIAVISILFFIIMCLRQSLIATKIQSVKNSSEELSVIHCNGNEVYDFVNQNLSSLPMIITDVLIGNTDFNGNIETEYGKKIPEVDTMYLRPKVKYFGIKSGVQTLRVRWIKPDGSISKGNTSLGNFSQVSGYNISAGKSDEICLSGWGGTNKGHWIAGQYFIEIWYDEIRLIRKPFTIY